MTGDDQVDVMPLTKDRILAVNIGLIREFVVFYARSERRTNKGGNVNGCVDIFSKEVCHVLV